MITKAITDRLANVDGQFGVDYINLGTDQEFSSKLSGLFRIRRRNAHGYCGMLPRHQRRRAEREQRIPPLSKDYKDDAEPSYGVLKYLHDGIEVTVSDLYNLTATVSDNMAFNVLTDILGIEKINQTFRALGYTDMRINRKINDRKKMTEGVQNYVSVREMAALFHRIYKGQLISEEVSENLLSLLKQHQRTSMIPYLQRNRSHCPSPGLRGYHHRRRHRSDRKPFILVMAAQDTDIRKAQTIMRIIIHRYVI